MSDVSEQTEDESVEPLTGSGAPEDGGGLPPEDDAEPAVDADDADEPVLEEQAAEHPEPRAVGFVHQDNVSEPGVQTTHNRVDGTSSSHGEPAAAAEEEDTGSEDADPED